MCVCNEITKLHENYYYGKIEEIYKKMSNDINSLKGEYVILINNEPVIKENKNISIEALIVDIIVNKNCSIKEAVNILNKDNSNLSKKEIYNAGLKLKEILKK